MPILYQIRPEINAYWSFVILGRSDCRNTKRIGIRSTFVFRFVFIYFFLHNILVIAVSMMINCSSSTFFIQCLLQTLNTIESLVIMIELDWLNSILFLHCIFKKKQTNKKRRLKIESLFLFFFFNLFNHTYIYTYCISINVYF